MEDAKKKAGIGDTFVRVLNGMAQGLFASLIIGLIIKQIGHYCHLPMIENFGQIAQYMTGPAIGIGVAYALHSPALALFSSAVVGAIGAGTIVLGPNATFIKLALGEPMGAMLASLCGAWCGCKVAGKSKVDIIVVPIVTIIIGGLVGVFLSPVVSAFMNAIGSLINRLTMLYPFPMGLLVAVVVGIVLTLPISSAAICISLGLSGLAAGAACVGCCCQMVGFAVSSYRENRIGGLISQGLGTSMLQIPNIMRNYLIWIPPTLASAVLGPISTCVFKMTNNKAGAGMGTSGLVGQINALATMGTSFSTVAQILLMHFILPAAITLLFSEIMRKKGWIKPGDMALSA